MAAKHHHFTKRTLALALATAALAGTLGGEATAAARSDTGSRPPAVQIVRVTTHNFDWGDAAIGSAAGIGISMLAVGATLLIISNRQHRKPRPRLTAKEQS
jgi:hypothetical protein